MGQDIKTQSLIALLIRLSSSGMLIVFNGLLAHLLQPEDMGLFLYISSGILFCTLLGCAGLPQVISRATSQYQISSNISAISTIMKKSLTISLILGSISAIIFYSLHSIKFFQNNLSPLVFLSWVLSSIILRLYAEKLRGQGCVNTANILTNIGNIGFLVCLIGILTIFSLMSIFHLRLASIIGIMAAASTAVAIIAIMAAKHYRIENPPRHPVAFATTSQDTSCIGLLSQGLPLLFAGLSLFVFLQGDIWLVRFFADNATVALYGIASKLAAVGSMFLMALNSVVQPIVATQLVYSGRNLQEDKIKRMVFSSFILNILVFIIFIFYGKQLLALFFGDYYEEGYAVLLVLSTGHLVSSFCGPAAMSLAMSGNQMYLMWANLSALAVFLLGSSVLAPHFGILGIAASSAISWAAVNIANAYGARKLLGTSTVAFSLWNGEKSA